MANSTEKIVQESLDALMDDDFICRKLRVRHERKLFLLALNFVDPNHVHKSFFTCNP
ncbi:hypothetical protein [Lentibacillus sp. CBA3610]|uniref:hypothetical protein n=1 Tax=Lentibacillus sp. CBA3610 TaxID=2518176 RepID=UPI0020D25A66|nr:hypothetical protein [Lentibacillus sp. CBA3610]